MEAITHFHIRENRSLKQACLDEALKCLSRGEKNFSLRDIARTLNVSHGAPYKHFETKEDLLVEIAKQGYEELFQNLKSDVDSAHSEIEKILKFGFGFQKFAEFQPQKFALMFDPDSVDFDGNAELFQNFNSIIEILADISTDLESQGKLNTDMKAKDLASFILTWNLGLAQALMLSRASILGAAMSMTEKRFREMAMPLISAVQI